MPNQRMAPVIYHVPPGAGATGMDGYGVFLGAVLELGVLALGAGVMILAALVIL